MAKGKGGTPALFLDLDDTVRRCKVKSRPFPIHPDEQEILPGRHEKIWEYKNKGYKVFGVTNQGGIATGQLTSKQCEACLHDLNKKLDMAFDNIAYARSYPGSDDYYRKPNPGMIHYFEKEHGIDLSRSLMVGDRDTDKMAAHRAGVKFMWTKDFFHGDTDEKA